MHKVDDVPNLDINVVNDVIAVGGAPGIVAGTNDIGTGTPMYWTYIYVLQYNSKYIRFMPQMITPLSLTRHN